MDELNADSEPTEDFGNELSDPDAENEDGMPPLKRQKEMMDSMGRGRKESVKKVSRVVSQQVKSRVQISSVVKLFVKKVHPSHVSFILCKNSDSHLFYLKSLAFIVAVAMRFKLTLTSPLNLCAD